MTTRPSNDDAIKALNDFSQEERRLVAITGMAPPGGVAVTLAGKAIHEGKRAIFIIAS